MFAFSKPYALAVWSWARLVEKQRLSMYQRVGCQLQKLVGITWLPAGCLLHCCSYTYISFTQSNSYVDTVRRS